MTGTATLVRSALGVGLLLLPAIVADAVPGAPWTWLLCCVLGMLTGYAVATARRAPPSRLPAVRAWYLGGTAVGQGFICWTASAYAGGALGWGRLPVFVLAVALLAVCLFVAYRGWGDSARFRHLRLGATLAVAVMWLCRPGALRAGADVLGPAPGVLGAVFLVLISVVGWESTRGALGEPGPGSGWRAAGQVAVAGTVVVALTAGFTALRLLHSDPAPGSPPERVVLSLLVFVLAGSYCVSNLRVAGRLLDEFVRPVAAGMGPGTCWVALTAAAAMAWALVTGNGTWQLLLGPGSMTWAILALYTGRVLIDRTSPLPARMAAAAAGAVLCAVAVPMWPALLFPASAALLAVASTRVSAVRRRRHEKVGTGG